MQLIVKNTIPILLLRLQRFEKTNEMLSNCNSLSQTRLERALRDFRGHTQHINGLKKELEQVFKRIRVIKSRVAQQYPEAFKGNLLGKSIESDFGPPPLKMDHSKFIFLGYPGQPKKNLTLRS